MNIVITGANGFLGNSLKIYFLSQGFVVTPVFRKDFQNADLLYEKLESADVIINLAGESIIQRWSNKGRKNIVNSRISTTNSIVDFLNKHKNNVHLINASAIGIYNSTNRHDEFSTDFSSNFLFDVISGWEQSAEKLNTNRNLLSVIRIGLVLGNGGGAFRKYYGLTKWFLGGSVGSGKQFFSFIHINDFCRAIDFVIQNKISGILNVTTPQPTTNKIFVKTLGKQLKRPTIFFVPTFILKLFFGNAHILFSEGQSVMPKRLLDYGFKFKYSNIADSIKALINSYPE